MARIGRASAALLVLVAAAASAPGTADAFSLETRRPRLTGGRAQAVFDHDAAHLEIGGRRLLLRAASIGRAGTMGALSTRHDPVGDEAEVRTQRGLGVVEWWRSDPDGLEHGLTLARRPIGSGDLVLELRLGGAAAAVSSADAAIDLIDAAGARFATYGGLAVRDARRAAIPARLDGAGRTIRITIDDRDAEYPIVVDPLLVGVVEHVFEDTVLGSHFGAAVALSPDGTRAVIGAPYQSGPPTGSGGAAQVWVRDVTGWSREAELDRFTTLEIGDEFGWSVAISGDGARILVGSPADTTGGGAAAGSVHVFVRSVTGTWSEEASLFASDGAGGDYFGASLALDQAGSVAAIGAPGDDSATWIDVGSVRVFTRSGTVWTEASPLFLDPAEGVSGLGIGLAITPDAARLIVTSEHAVPESVHVFVSAAGTWTVESALHPPAGPAFTGFGSAVALSADGARALVGAAGASTSLGRSGEGHVFVRSGGVWAHEAVLLPAAFRNPVALGQTVALSADGTRAFLGAPLSLFWGTQGIVSVFVLDGSSWLDAATLTVPSFADAIDTEFASSLAVTADGTRALLGGPDPTRTGRAVLIAVRVADADGTACAAGLTCLSGFCADGVCCDQLCDAGSTTRCSACASALTGGTDGVCAPLLPALATTVTCRAAAGGCDIAEICNAGSTRCPDDGVQPFGYSCSPASATACQLGSVCDGVGAGCPRAMPAPAGTVCRPAANACDEPDTCDGFATWCGSDRPSAAETPCRAAVGNCDAVETCDGTSFTCPADELVAAGASCGGVGTCSTMGTCDGVSASCPGASVLAPGVVCLAATTSDACDVDDVCDGASEVCRPTFVAAGVVCSPPSGDPCDVPDVCSGTHGGCAPRVAFPQVCRPAAGACDVAEWCTGSSPICPGDALIGAGTWCRVSTQGCDPTESCDGASPRCPADVNTCGFDGSGALDGGARDAALEDANDHADTAGSADATTMSPDAARDPHASGGCGCRAGTSNDRPVTVASLFALAALGTGLRRRVRARREEHRPQ